MKIVLVPTDFSPAAGNALDVAMSIAKKENATLVLLHAVELPSSSSIDEEDEKLTIENWEQKIRTGLAHVLAGSIAEDLANHSVIPVLTCVTKRNR